MTYLLIVSVLLPAIDVCLQVPSLKYQHRRKAIYCAAEKPILANYKLHCRLYLRNVSHLTPLMKTVILMHRTTTTVSFVVLLFAFGLSNQIFLLCPNVFKVFYKVIGMYLLWKNATFLKHQFHTITQTNKLIDQSNEQLQIKCRR